MGPSSSCPFTYHINNLQFARLCIASLPMYNRCARSFLHFFIVFLLLWDLHALLIFDYPSYFESILLFIYLFRSSYSSIFFLIIVNVLFLIFYISIFLEWILFLSNHLVFLFLGCAFFFLLFYHVCFIFFLETCSLLMPYKCLISFSLASIFSFLIIFVVCASFSLHWTSCSLIPLILSYFLKSSCSSFLLL